MYSTTGLVSGSHVLVVEVTGTSNASSAGAFIVVDAFDVTVSNADTTPPAVSITAPASGATVSGSVTVSASASDNVGVGGVQFLVDGANLGSEDTSSPYSVSWNTTTLANGSHTLTATARDAAGNRTTSSPVTVTVSNGSPPPVTRFEETAATLAPAGAWSQVTNASTGVTLSGGQAMFAGAAGATASFTFSGTGVSWIGFQCEQCGIARVSLDGSVVATVDTYAPSRPASSGAMYSTTGLVSGSHVLVVEVTGTNNASSAGAFIIVDAFDVEGSTTGGGGGTTRVEETSPSVSYTGTWYSQARGDLSGGTFVESSDPSGTATLTFSGTGVTWIGFKGPWAGIAQVYLDGTLKATVDTYAPTEQAQAVLYTASGLASGSHALKITVTNTWNPSSASAWIVVDAFDVTSGGPSSPPPDTTPPTVSITSPASGATVSGTTTLSASASDNVGVVGVQFLVDGSNAGSEDTSSPYSVSWNTATVANGSHTLTAVARDAAGNRTTSAPVTVTVSNATSSTRFEESSATLAPAASWSGVTSTSTGVTLSGDFAVIAPDAGATATFTFSGTGVSWIGFKCERCGIARVHLDGAVVATVDTYAASRPAASGSLYSTTGLAAGSHTLVIEVTGTNNASSVGPFIVVDAFDVM